jgi:acetate kinase
MMETPGHECLWRARSGTAGGGLMVYATRVLTLNIGSSSLKAALYEVGAADDDALLVFAAHTEQLGSPHSRMSVQDAQGATLFATEQGLSDHPAALQTLQGWLQQQSERDFSMVGHRVVFGGQQHREPQLITDNCLASLDDLSRFDPLHMPQALHVIAYMRQEYPHIAQVACFDTAFHQTMPQEARLYGLPYALADAGVIRYGFHGLSCESILLQLRAIDPAAAEGRVIIAHLGAGASMTAVRNGMSLDTTMGFTPTSGLVMGTRSGDLDPGVVLYLLEERRLDAAALRRLFTAEAGMLGVSGVSGDMRDLLEQSSTNPRAAAAVALFCYQARKYLGALAAALGGIETLVFTGGIGEHAPQIRGRICANLDFLGVNVDNARNVANAAVISAEGSPVTIRVMQSEEDRMIARHTYRLMQQGKAGHTERRSSISRVMTTSSSGADTSFPIGAYEDQERSGE